MIQYFGKVVNTLPNSVEHIIFSEHKDGLKMETHWPGGINFSLVNKEPGSIPEFPVKISLNEFKNALKMFGKDDPEIIFSGTTLNLSLGMVKTKISGTPTKGSRFQPNPDGIMELMAVDLKKACQSIYPFMAGADKEQVFNSAIIATVGDRVVMFYSDNYTYAEQILEPVTVGNWVVTSWPRAAIRTLKSILTSVTQNDKESTVYLWQSSDSSGITSYWGSLSIGFKGSTHYVDELLEEINRLTDSLGATIRIDTKSILNVVRGLSAMDKTDKVTTFLDSSIPAVALYAGDSKARFDGEIILEGETNLKGIPLWQKDVLKSLRVIKSKEVDVSSAGKCLVLGSTSDDFRVLLNPTVENND